MMKDKLKEQEDTIKSLKQYRERCEELEGQLKESKHTAVTTTQQAEVRTHIGYRIWEVMNLSRKK